MHETLNVKFGYSSNTVHRLTKFRKVTPVPSLGICLSLYWYTFYLLYTRLLVLIGRIKLSTICTLALYINQWPLEQLFYNCSIGSHVEPTSVQDGQFFHYYEQWQSQGSAVKTLTTLQAGWLRCHGLTCQQGKGLSLLQSIQTDPGAYPVSYSMGTRSPFPRAWSWTPIFI